MGGHPPGQPTGTRQTRRVPPAGPGPRPVRADAQRNRARLLDAAERVFALHGVAASTEEIARQAGVGIGTVFRHFPTKEALLEAVFRRRLQQLATHADALANAPDPGAAFFGFVSHVVELAVTQRAQIDALADAMLAQMARDLGHDEDAARYAARAQNYRSVFDASTGFFRARDASGAFTGPADPAQSEGFHEGTAWQYQWLVPQDPALRFKVAAQAILDGQTDAARRALRPLAYDPHQSADNPAARLITILDTGVTGPAAMLALAKARGETVAATPCSPSAPMITCSSPRTNPSTSSS